MILIEGGVWLYALLRRWCMQIAQGLLCLHKLGIVHGDIKLENIMLTDTEDGAITESDVRDCVGPWGCNV